MEDYEKKYKSAMEAMRQWIAPCHTKEQLNVLKTSIFPELKESEGENIRKSIIGFLKTIASLKDGKTVSNADFDSVALLEWAAWLEKQSEQKPVDKVESKFKVGDWIINSVGALRHILDVNKTGYQTDKGWLTRDYYEKCFHLWTIQDAKDGDVLCCENGWTCIFKSLNSNSFSSYCFMDCGKWFCELGGECHSLNEKLCGKIHPATKEQCDILFAKMKEAGYEWDAEKKELKKIEPKLINEYNEHELTAYETKKWNEAYEKGYEIGYMNGKNEQKPAWSEDDEKMINDIIEVIDEEYVFDYQKIVNWLKSLKERYTWKPTNEQMEALLKLEEMHVLEHENNQENAHLYMVVKSIREQLLKLKGE